ncbi:vitamin D3 hydroxylase-associated protein-like [Tachysurus fulvidraco]|uniref:vitamin D3 hydroxylase-associated protein-like n=1 Tax=Tachysurus fulvidraco TaxID=1234273 RepID=UPI001FED66EA|nr:vitamin D3 hydroxylase-associated protein-like [Tachysurus fulvidraco]XP_026999163.2 vitamin D3 hydroxylase-associated protein-like [Tachysurus fulvidraco]
MDGEWKSVAVSLLCAAGVSVLLLKWREQQKVKRKLQRAREKREKEVGQAEKAVNRFKTQNAGVDLSSIVTLSLAELSQKIRGGSLQPNAVLHAYMEKALEVNRELNCSTAVLMESLKQVEEVESHKEGLLYGIPVSIKDNVDIKGYDSTCGVLTKLDDPVIKDSVVVSVLKKQGAIPFIKTNVPQGLLNYECSNPIYGRTVNPCNLQKTCGGSSGGEGALIAGGGSILGLGTDIGGSIRIPAAFCGICGLKPTNNRLSLHGINSCAKGGKTALSAVGPMARDVESLALCMRALLCTDMFTLDPTVPPIPFNQQVYESSEPLRIGYYENDGYFQPSPSMSRALRETRELLEQAGHTLVAFNPPRIVTAFHEFVLRGNLADTGATLLQHFKEGPVDQCLKYQVSLCAVPVFVKKLISLLLRPIYPRMAAAVHSICGVSSVADLWKQHTEAEVYIQETLSQWEKLELDVLLCPMLGPAYNFNYTGKLSSALTYTALYNVLNFPVGVVPVTVVTDEDEEELKHYTGNYGDVWDKTFIKAIRGGVGLPVAVQCVARPWQEEMCLRLMREVEKLCAENKHSKTHH